MNPAGLGLVCAATEMELQTLGLQNAENLEPRRLWKIPAGYAAVTGVGIPATLIRLPPRIESLRPAWILNLGIAGAYPDSGLAVGDIVVATSETFADLGLELPDAELFQPLSQLPFADPLTREPLSLWTPAWIQPSDHAPRIRLGRGATVNSCTGRSVTGKLRRRLFGADFESMEGAAVALAAVSRGLPVCEVRAVSNVAADRDMRPENIARALQSLKTFWERHAGNLS